MAVPVFARERRVGGVSGCNESTQLVAGGDSTCTVMCDEEAGYSAGHGTYACPPAGGESVVSLMCDLKPYILKTTFGW